MLLVVFFWALNFVIGKVALREMPPLMVAGLRTLLSGAFVWPIYFARASKREPHERWTASEFPLLALVGIVGVVLNQLFFIIGLSMTSVAHAAIIVATSPLLVLVVAWRVGQETITARRLAGMLVAMGGIAILQAGKEPGRGPTLLGDFFIFLSGVTFAMFTVLGKRLTTRHGSVTVTTFAYVGGAICLLPLTIWQSFEHPPSALSAWAWLSVVYMSLFPSVISYLIFSYALKYLAASRVSTFSYLQPLIATVLAAVFLREMPAAGFVAGGACVLAGVFLAERG